MKTVNVFVAPGPSSSSVHRESSATHGAPAPSEPSSTHARRWGPPEGAADDRMVYAETATAHPANRIVRNSEGPPAEAKAPRENGISSGRPRATDEASTVKDDGGREAKMPPIEAGDTPGAGGELVGRSAGSFEEPGARGLKILLGGMMGDPGAVDGALAVNFEGRTITLFLRERGIGRVILGGFSIEGLDLAGGSLI